MQVPVGLSFYSVEVEVMRIEVIDKHESATPQVRAYAEYRLFATLAQFALGIRSVRVIVHVKRQGVTDRATCVVTVTFEPSGSVVVRAYGQNVHGAIDRAAVRIGDLITRRLPQLTHT